MAVLSSVNRAIIWSEIMSLMSLEHEPVSITKADLRAAVDAIDQWAEDNATAFNSAIPQPARASLTAKQKARLLAYVVLKRYEVS